MLFMTFLIYYQYRQKVAKLKEQQLELKEKVNQLIELNTYKDNLFTVVARDIRDPLGVLLNLLELLEEELEEKQIEELAVFQKVFTKVKNTYMLVEQLLDWYRSQQEKPVLNQNIYQLLPIVQQAMITVETWSKSKNIEVINSVEDHIHVYADQEMIHFILRNLLSNAIKYTKIGGTIWIGTMENDDKVIVFVKDSGIGISQEMESTLFRVRQQMSTPGTMNERGTGLGLYLVSKFVQLHGGEIWFESKSGMGSTFFFSLPNLKQL